MSHVPADGLEAGREALRRFLVGDDDLQTMLAKIASLAVEGVPGCDMASITLVGDGRPHTPVYTDEAALVLDQAQYAAGDGPCLAAIRHQGVERCDTAGDDRWPGFVAEATRQGVRGTVSVPLVSRDAAVGGLNLYSTTMRRFVEESCDRAALFADQVGVAAANAAIYAERSVLAAHLQEAMRSRAAIEQAKGILMAAERCGPDEAFDILRAASQHRNRKLREIAEEIVASYAGRGDGSPRSG